MSKFLKSKAQKAYQQFDNNDDDDPFDASIDPADVLHTNNTQNNSLAQDIEASNIINTEPGGHGLDHSDNPFDNSNNDLENQLNASNNPPLLKIACHKWDSKQASYFFLTLGVLIELLNYHKTENYYSVDAKSTFYITVFMLFFILFAHILGIYGVYKNHPSYVVFYIISLFMEIAEIVFTFFAKLVFFSWWKAKINGLILNWDELADKHAETYVLENSLHISEGVKSLTQVEKEARNITDDSLEELQLLHDQMVPYMVSLSFVHVLRVLVTCLELHFWDGVFLLQCNLKIKLIKIAKKEL